MRTALAFALLAFAATPPTATLAATDDLAAVLEAVIRQVVLARVVGVDGGPLPAGWTIRVQTDLAPISPGYPTEIPPPPEGGDPVALEPWTTELPLQFASATELRPAAEMEGSKAVHEAVRKVLCTVQFSAVRFQTAPERRAMVEVALVWGADDAEGCLVDLRWRDGSWRVVSILPGWIA